MGKNKCMVLGINNFGPTGINFENYHYFCIIGKVCACTFCKNVKTGNFMSVIEYRNVDIQIDSKIILENVTFTLDRGEFAYIVGAVGSGKSTLLKTIYGEVDIDGGEALVFDKYDLADISNRKLQELRRRIGIVFQDFQLLTDRNVFLNLFGLDLDGFRIGAGIFPAVQTLYHNVDQKQEISLKSILHMVDLRTNRVNTVRGIDFDNIETGLQFGGVLT